MVFQYVSMRIKSFCSIDGQKKNSDSEKCLPTLVGTCQVDIWSLGCCLVEETDPGTDSENVGADSICKMFEFPLVILGDSQNSWYYWQLLVIPWQII